MVFGNSIVFVTYADRLLGFDLESYFKVRAMCFIYKLIRTRTPSYLKFITMTGRSSRTNQLVVPRYYSQQCRDSLRAKGIVDWNSLPNDIRPLTTVFEVIVINLNLDRADSSD